MRQGRIRFSHVAAPTALVVAASLLMPVQAPAQAASSRAPVPTLEKSVPLKPVVSRRVTSRSPREYVGHPVTWPVGARDLSIARKPSSFEGLTLKKSPGAAASTIRVQALSRTVSESLGLAGPAFRLTGKDLQHTEVSYDYQAISGAFGADYARRLRLVVLPACALTRPQITSCHSALPLKSQNSVSTRSLSSASLNATAGASTLIVAAAATASGSTGTFSATSLSPVGSWTSGSSSGSFTYNYPISVPNSPAGHAPAVSFSYDSGSVDGRTASANNQTSWVGEGWDYSPGYVERSYRTCREVTGAPAVDDQCWAGQILTMNLDGASYALVQDDTTKIWHLKSDDNEQVSLKTGGVNGDVNGEYWVITKNDGTSYYFGLNRLPGWVTGKATTNSTLTTRVYHPATDGTTCHTTTFATSFCQQAWRWNLDYVVDTHGNASSYYYTQETNYYGANAGTAGVAYVRGAYLSRIDYGMRSSSVYTVAAPNQVVFAVADRCNNATATTCSGNHTATYWPDVPWDQNCASGAACAIHSPSYWTTKRLLQITTKVITTPSTSTYGTVDTYDLTHTYPDPGDGTTASLWLSQIVHTGNDTTAGGTAAVPLPATTFSGTLLSNRIDTTSAYPPMNHYRISLINTGTGESIGVTYTGPECTTTNLPAAPQSDTMRCYQAAWTPPGATTPVKNWWNKYLVAVITEQDNTGGAPTKTTTYTYKGGAAWHYDDNEVLKSSLRTYGQWRGYGDVETRVGTGGQPQTLSEQLFFRGMDADKLPAGTRTVTISDTRGNLAVTDNDALAGQTLETLTFNGSGGPEVSDTVSSYSVNSTASQARTASSLPTLLASMTRNVGTSTRTALAVGGWRTTEIDTSYNTAGLATQTSDLGDTGSSGDEVCTTTTYASNVAIHLLDSVQEVESSGASCVAVNSGTGFSRATNVISDVRTSFDNQAFGAIPTVGDSTQTDTAIGWSGTAYTYLTTNKNTYDAYGRVTSTTDPRTGTSTTTSYTPATGQPATSTSNIQSYTDASGVTQSQTATTTFSALRSLPTHIVDANNFVTDADYDALGRVTSVWKPGRAKTSSASTKYAYSVSQTAINAVTTQTLLESGAYRTSIALFDGLTRPRQTQDQSPLGGRILTDVFYDTRGYASKTNAQYWNSTTTPAATLVQPLGDNLIPDQTRTTFDGLGRPTDVASYYLGAQTWHTVNSYGGDRINVTPPSGGTPTTSINDARGRTIEIDQYLNPTLTGTPQATTYHYNSLGELDAMNSGGRAWAWGYDFLGRITSSADPDSGTTTTRYDTTNNSFEITTDANGQVLTSNFDGLGRKVALYSGDHVATPTVPKLSSWVYDTLANGKGRLTSSTSYNNGNAYTVAASGYNGRGQLLGTQVILPAAEGALAGTYSFPNAYSANVGLLTANAYPAGGGLTAETDFRGYNALDLPNGSGGANKYINATSYTAFGEPSRVDLGFGASTAYQSNTYDEHTRRLTSQLLDRTTTPSRVQQLDYSYDNYGNVVRQTDTRALLGTTDTQCFSYDSLQRLTTAWTALDACAASPSTTTGSVNVGGPAPYWSNWTYDPVGNRQAQTTHDPAGLVANTVTAYGFNGNAAGQPDTLTSKSSTGPTGTTSESDSYDKTGQLISLSGSAGSQTLAWTEQHRLASSTRGTLTSKFLYDADNNLLIRRDPGTTIAYLPNEELALNTSTNTVTGTRYYTQAGAPSAVKSGATFSFLIGDQHGTALLTLDSTAQLPTYRYSTPFGGPRGSASAWPDDHTFLGKPTDSTIGLTLIGARPYDTALGRFVSVDPLLSQTDPQSLSGYAYSNNNPQTLSDPTGCYKEKLVGSSAGSNPTTDNSSQSNNSGTSTSNTSQLDQPHTDHHWWDRASSGFHDVVCGIGNGLWYVGPGLVGSLERMGPGPINNWVADQFDATHDRLERWGGANVDSWTYRTGTATGFVVGTIATGGTSAAVRGSAEVIEAGAVVKSASVAAESGGARFVAGAEGVTDTLGGSPNAISLGHFPDYVSLGSRTGAKTFSISDEVWSSMSTREQWVRNQSFLDRGIANGSEFRLATPVEAARPGSFYERELQYMFKQGYSPNADGTMLVRGGS